MVAATRSLLPRSGTTLLRVKAEQVEALTADCQRSTVFCEIFFYLEVPSEVVLCHLSLETQMTNH